MSSSIASFLKQSFSIRGAQNLLAWGVAGGAAYWLWVLPQQREAERRRAIVEEWKEKYRNEPSRYPMDRSKQLQDAAAAAPALAANKPSGTAKQ